MVVESGRFPHTVFDANPLADFIVSHLDPSLVLNHRRKLGKVVLQVQTHHCKAQHSVGKVLLYESHQIMGKFLVQLLRTSMGIKFL